MQFTRLNDVRVVSPQSDLPPEAAELLQVKFSDLFGPVVFLDGLMPPVGGAFDGLAQFDSRHLRLEEGWITLGFDEKRE